MCGVAGVVGSGETQSDVDLVRQMCRMMVHRGPDDMGSHVGPGAVLGQSRLSIVDLKSGHQPLCNESATVWIACNGEIYNYRELRSELIKRGHRFSTQSDTEVIVHLYEERGIDLVHDLNGMYAFALWDAGRHVTYLVRDRLGIKPLYYNATRAGRVEFASELKALLLAPQLDRTYDLEAIAEYLTLGYINEPRTPFRAIRKVLSGSYLEVRAGQIRSTQYWRVPVRVDPAVRPLDDLCEELRALLKDATRLQMRSDVPVGVFASGGLDSSAIMWAVAEQGQSVAGYFCEFEGLDSERHFARMAARSTRMRLHEAKLTAGDANRMLPKLVWHADEPIADSAIIPCYLIAKDAASHVKVMLNGTGGDEVFGGYARYNLRGAVHPKWSSLASRLIRKAGGNHPAAQRFGAVLDYRERLFRRMALIPEQDARYALGLDHSRPVHDSISALFMQVVDSDPAAAMMHVELQTYLRGNLFMVLDKIEHGGVPGSARAPYGS